MVIVREEVFGPVPGVIPVFGFGLPEAGQSGIEFFTEHKVVYVGY